MDSNDEIERILERMDQRADEASKETVALLKQMAKTMAAMSEETKKSLSEDTKHRRQERMRDDARARREQSSNKNSGTGKAGEVLKNSMNKAGKAVDGFAGMLTITTDSLHDMVGVLKMFPIVGGLVATALGTLIVGGIQNTIDSFRQLNKHGVVFGDSIFDVNIAAVQAGLSIKEFSDLVSKYGVIMNTYGVDSVMNFSRSLASSDSELRKLGLTTRDITEFSLDYLEMRRNLGGNDELGDNLKNQKARMDAESFAKSIALSSMQTGQSIDELRKAILGGTKDAGMALSLSNLESSNATEISTFLASQPWAKKMIQDLLTFGVSADLEALRPFMGEFATSVEKLVDGTGTSSEALTALGKDSKATSEEVRKTATIAGESNTQWALIRDAIAAGIVITNKSNEDLEAELKKRQILLERTTKVDQMIQDLKNATFLPFLEGLEKFEKQVDMEELGKSMKELGDSVGDMLAKVFTPENISTAATWVATVTNAIAGMVSFISKSFGITGLVGLGLAFAFGPKLAFALITTVTKSLGSLLVSQAAGLLGGGLAGKGGGASIFAGLGPKLAKGLLFGTAAASLGRTLVMAIDEGVKGELSAGTIGSGAGSLVGGLVGALFGGPVGAALGVTIGGFIGEMVGNEIDKMRVDKRENEITKGIKQEISSLEEQIANAKTVKEAKALMEQADAKKVELVAEGDKAEQTWQVTDDMQAKIMNQMFSSYGTMFDGMLLDDTTKQGFRDKYSKYSNPDAWGSTTEARQATTKEVIDQLIDLSKNGSWQAHQILQSIGVDDGMKSMGGGSGPWGMPKFANGGVATQPSIFGDAGAEAAIPLDSGMRIPIAEVSMEGMQEIQQMAQNNTLMVSTLNDVKQSLDRFLKFMQSNNRSAEELDVMLGMYAKLDDIAGSSQTMVRNFRSVF